MGWFKESECENPWLFDTDIVTSNITLYGKWVPAHTVTYAWSGLPEGENLYTENGAIVVPALPHAITGIGEGEEYAIDTLLPGTIVYTHNAAGVVDGYYTLGNWADPNNGVMGDTDVVVRAVWTRTPVDNPGTLPDPTPVPDPVPTPDPEPTTEPTPTPEPTPEPVPTPIPEPEPTPVPTPIPTPAPAATVPGAPVTLVPAAVVPTAAATPIEQAIADGGTPLAEAIEDEILDDGNPLAAFDEPWCWVHWWIVVGMVLTMAYALVALARRRGYSKDVDRYDDQVMGRDEGKASPAARTQVEA